ncbi:MAG: cadherin-like beta sandwich domain-containing protein, partial [Angelakisella sp.]
MTIIHQQPSTVSSLESITVTDADGKEVLKQTAPTLKPGAYAVTVPYATRWVKFAVEKSDPWSTVSFTPKLQTKGKGIFGLLGIGDDWQKLTHPDDPTAQGDATTNQTITVTAQNTALQWASTYNINITRDAPSKNTMAQSLTIKDQLERKITFDKPTEKFEKTIKKYAVHIPYSSEELTLSILPDELVAQSVTVISPDGTTETKDYKDKNAPLDFTIKTPPTDLTTTKFAITFKVKSEGNTETDPLYTINVVRNPPSIDDAISEMLVTDQADETVKTFSYNPQQLDYTFAVPFNTEWLKITPKARSPLATITVKAGNKAAETISELNPNVVTPTLKSNVPMIIVVTIKPEDKAAAGRVYTLNVTREAPNTDARLKELVVTGGEKLKPDFIPNTTAYKVKLPTGTKALTFTPVPIAPGATVTINGNNAEVGKPSLPYEPIEVI